MNVATNIIDTSPGSSSFVADAPDAGHEPASTSELSVETRHLRRSLLDVVTENLDKRAMLSAVAHIISEYASLAATFYFPRDPNDSLLPGLLLGGEVALVSDNPEKDLFAIAEAACDENQLNVRQLDANLFALPVPVYLPHNMPEVFTAVFSPTSQSSESLVGMLEMVAVHITLWQVQQEAVVKEFEAQSTAALQELLAKLEACRDLQHACRTLVDELQQYVECQRLALALYSGPRGRSRLQAISGSPKFDKHSPFVAAVESTLDEAILRDALTVWPPVSPGDRHAALAHHKLCSVADVPCVVSSPLRGQDGEAIGAWLFLGTKQCFEHPNTLNFIRASEPRVASCLSLLQRAGGGPIAKLRKSLLAGKRPWKLKITLLVLCTLLAILSLPMPYKICCECRLEPVSRRFVAAPYDGILQKALVSAGATVAEGEVLARMDGREIRWELAGNTAERDRAVKQSDAAFANHEFAAAKVAKLEAERLELKLRLLEQRQRDLNIKSPIEGIVTVGDLDKAQGAPVTCGQTLFEIAPLKEMMVEVAIPQSEILYVRKGQHVVVRLEACPNAPYLATITRIHPRSEIREQQNVFIAEVTLRNAEGNLRPGMHGLAKIIGPRRSLAWNLFHKAWESLCLTLGW